MSTSCINATFGESHLKIFMHESRSGAIFDGSGNPEIIRFRLYPFKIIFLAPSRLQKCKKNRFFLTNKVEDSLNSKRRFYGS